MNAARHSFAFCGFLLLLAAALPVTAQAPNTAKPSQADPIEALAGKWDSRCMPKGCVMFTDVLIGDPDHPADPAHPQYLTMAVAINRSDREPAFFDFDFPPDADRGQGAFVTFGRTERVGNKWKLALVKPAIFHLNFFSCDHDSCIGRVTGHVVPATDGNPPVDVLHEFLTDDQILFLFTRNGVPYRTIKALFPFQRDYRHLMDTEFKAPAKR